jgi:glucuronate isomerase
VTRLLHASGVPLADLGVGRAELSEEESRRIWRILCETRTCCGAPRRGTGWSPSWPTPSGVAVRPSAEIADVIYDHVAARLAKDASRPALFEQFGIEVLATTDDPCDDGTTRQRPSRGAGGALPS